MSDSERSVKITKRVVDATKPNGTDFYVFDSELIGFGIRVRKTGGMAYIARYRAGSGRHAPVRRVTIAKVGKVTPEQARDAAKAVLASVVKGNDPARDKAGDRKALTFNDLADKFIAHIEAIRKPTTASQYRQLLDLHAIPEFGKRKAASIDVTDVSALHLKLSKKPAAANRLRAILSSMYSWGIKSKTLPKMDNPASDVGRYREKRRERFLSTDEISRLAGAIQEAETIGIPWAAPNKKLTKHAPKPENRLVKIDATAAAAFRLLLLTGARLREILHLKWEQIDFERGLLLLPESKTGQKTIVLNAPALSILSDLPRAGIYVVASESVGTKDEKPRADLKRPWAMLVRRAELGKLRIHDLRHSFASFGAGGGMGLPIIGKLLGHSQPATTNRYAHLDADPLRRASNAIGKKISDAMNTGPKVQSADVIPLRTENR
ncbi:MAG TPA: tyrosine-type recombinase/integrase [Pseudaminobacter sp.]|nr:tyrosine-type recombinase/integrase [Pseudaminobacter sp.]